MAASGLNYSTQDLSCSMWALNCGVQASLGAVRVFLSSGGKWALEHTGSVVAVWLQGMWDLSCHSRIEPGSPKLEGRFLTTGPRILKKIFE